MTDLSILQYPLSRWMLPLNEPMGNELTPQETPTFHIDTPLQDWLTSGCINQTCILSDDTNRPIGCLLPETVIQDLLHELENGHNFLSTLLQNVHEAVTIVNETGIVTHWNQTAVDLYGIQKDEIIGKPILDFNWESLMIGKILDEGRPVEQIYHEPKPGTHVLINASPVVSGDRIVGAISSEQDVTKLVRLNNELFSTSSQLRDLEQEMTRISQTEDPFSKIKGGGATIERSTRVARRVATTNATVLLTGESGVGKELFARAIHQASTRSEKPFIAINCGAIPAALFESELFGYQGGAFTGAARGGKPGKLELAHEGTLFLDEIGELPLDMQVKLLRVLQDGQFFRVGGSKPITVDTRILAATNRSLEAMMAEGLFREDLFYRLNVVSIEIPPLRERIEDLPELVQIFLRECALQYGKPAPELDPEVIVTFMNYAWPGNIRQLRNVIERLVILSEGDIIVPQDLPSTMQSPNFSMAKGRYAADSQTSGTNIVQYEQGNGHIAPSIRKLEEVTSDAERETIMSALELANGNRSRAAEHLGISRGTLYNKMRRCGLTSVRR